MQSERSCSYKSVQLQSGDGGIRTLVPRRANAFRVRPVMTTSIRLHNQYEMNDTAVDSRNCPQLLYYSRLIGKRKALILIILFCLNSVGLSLSCHLIALKILVIGRDLVDKVSARHDLHDAVGGRLHDLMVS